MAVISPAIGVQSGSHSALAFRQLGAALAGADVTTFVGGPTALDVGHGLVRTGMLAVTQNGTPNMSVNVAKGTALVNGSSVLAQGIYAVTNDATVNLAIATADATNPRRDLVCIQVRDNTADASGFNDARLFVITGTPAASPVDPAVPAGCLVLARVAVAALASSIVNANITTLAGLARGSAWNQAWGQVGYAEATSNQAGITTIADLTSLSVTFTAVAGRRYKFYAQALLGSSVSTDVCSVFITDGSNAQIAQGDTGAVAGAYAVQVVTTVVKSNLGAGSVTYKVRAQRTGSGSLTNFAASTFPSILLVEDIGPA